MNENINFCVRCGIRSALVVKEFENPKNDFKHYLHCRNCDYDFFVFQVQDHE